MERDRNILNLHSNNYISTHTLTWSVTSWNFVSSAFHKISTHTLTWSVTADKTTLKGVKGNFNSHAHVERDIILFWRFVLLLNFNSHAHVERDDNPQLKMITNGISTHTLTWSVTKPYHFLRTEYQFQLTRSRGA